MDEVRLATQAREPLLGDVLTWGGDGWEPRSEGPRAFAVTHVHTERQVTVAMGPQRSPNFVSGSSGWQILEDGSAEFNDVVVRGTLYATVGEIGGWTINADNITGGDAVLHSGGYLLLGSGDDVVRVDAQNATWRLWVGDASGGDAPFRVSKTGEVWANNITARGEIRTAVLRYDEVHATSGMLLVTPNAAKLAVDLLIGSMGYFNVGEAGRFAANDIVRLKDGTNDVWLTVIEDGGDGTYGYTLASGSEDVTFGAGTAVVGYGASGEGGVLLDAVDAHAPFVDVFTHGGSPWSSITTKTRMGNLAGITDADLNPSGYGLYSENVFLRGSLVAGGGNVVIDSTGIEILTAGYNLLFNPNLAGSKKLSITGRYVASASEMYFVWDAGGTPVGMANLYVDEVPSPDELIFRLDPTNALNRIKLKVGSSSLTNFRDVNNDLEIWAGGAGSITLKAYDGVDFKDSVSGNVVAQIDSGGKLKAADGSAAAPALSFLSDMDTGIYRSAANQVSIATGGTERVRVGSSGLIVDTGTGNQPLWITRLGSTDQGLKLYTDDLSAIMESVQDEASGAYAGLMIRLGSQAGQSPNFGIVDYRSGSEVSRLHIDIETGYMGLGDVAPAYRLELPNTASVAGRGRANQWVTYSDKRIKQSGEKVSDALALIMKLRPVRYKAVDCEKTEDGLEFGKVARDWSYGLVAQELAEVLAEVVYRPEDEAKDLWGISYTELIPWLIAAIQELAGRVQ